MIKLIILHCLLIIIPVCIFFSNISSALGADKAPAPRKIIAAVPPDFPPTYYRDAQTGKPQGFAIDVMNEVARRAGLDG